MQTPLYSAGEALTRETFLALMQSLSYPGRIHTLPNGVTPFLAVAETLLDLETSFFTPDDTLHDALLRTGARALSIDKAAYHFYPVLSVLTPDHLQAASVGTMLYPDTGATVIIACRLDVGTRLRLTGPGIDGETHVSIDVPIWFFEQRAASLRYPLGWDVFLVDGERVLGLPRTTLVEVE
jgi:alpha-D-ribose 1-methylphosphonate 5-triphosphate synthase subunit PhnH